MTIFIAQVVHLLKVNSRPIKEFYLLAHFHWAACDPVPGIGEAARLSAHFHARLCGPVDCHCEEVPDEATFRTPSVSISTPTVIALVSTPITMAVWQAHKMRPSRRTASKEPRALCAMHYALCTRHTNGAFVVSIHQFWYSSLQTALLPAQRSLRPTLPITGQKIW